MAGNWIKLTDYPRELAGLSTLDRCEFRAFLAFLCAIGCIDRCETLVVLRAAVCFYERSCRRDMRSQSDDIRQLFSDIGPT